MVAVMERTESGALWLGESSLRPPLLVWRLLMRCCESSGMLVLKSIARKVLVIVSIPLVRGPFQLDHCFGSY